MPSQPLTVDRPSVPDLSIPRVAVRDRVALAVLALTALTFLVPSAPTYDPWAWIIWGREVLHLDLSTVDGPSWKPLPVLLTTPFALFGPLAPDLWLVRRARRGDRAASSWPSGVARRLGGRAGRRRRGGRLRRSRPGRCAMRRWATPRACSSCWPLAAVDRHLAGRRAARLPLGVGAALLRPEVWPFVGLYGLWLLWRERGARARLVAGRLRRAAGALAAARAVGLGRPAARRAPRARRRAPTAPPSPPTRSARCSTSSPRCCSRRVWIGLGALALGLVLRRAPSRRERTRRARPRRGGRVLGRPRSPYMTSDGFTGNTRYLILPAALACVLAGVGGRLARARACPRAARRSRCAALAAVAFAVPGVAPPGRRRATPSTTRPRLTDGLADVIAPRRRAASACWPAATPYTGAVPGARRRVAPGRAHSDAGRRSTRARRRSSSASRNASRGAVAPPLAERRRRGGRADVRHRRRLARSSVAAGERPRSAPTGAHRAGCATRSPVRGRLLARSRVGPSCPRRWSSSRCCCARAHPRALLDRRGPLGRASPRTRSPTSPGVLRQDGSPPLYYLLLSVWIERLRQRRGATRTRSRVALRAADRAGGVAGRARPLRRARRLDRPRCSRRSTRT